MNADEADVVVQHSYLTLDITSFLGAIFFDFNPYSLIRPQNF